jgi:hypothetical protein
MVLMFCPKETKAVSGYHLFWSGVTEQQAQPSKGPAHRLLISLLPGRVKSWVIEEAASRPPPHRTARRHHPLQGRPECFQSRRSPAQLARLFHSLALSILPPPNLATTQATDGGQHGEFSSGELHRGREERAPRSGCTSQLSGTEYVHQ